MDLCTLGASTVVNATGQYGLARASCQRLIDDDAPNAEKGEDLGEMPIGCALGLTALPAPPDASGAAEGIYERDVGGFGAVVVAGWDARAREVAGQMSPGDTCLHGTHSDATKRAKVFCKSNHLSLLVGNDVAVVIERENDPANSRKPSVKINAFGQSFEMSAENGILLAGDGGAYIQIKGGSIAIVGNVALGNSGAIAGPVAVGAGSASLASTSVFVCG
jgi:hypothetical protein